MKTIKTIIATSILLASVTTSAGVFNNGGSSTSRTESGTFTTAMAGSKAQAYQLGRDTLAGLQSSTHQQLAAKVGVNSGHPNLDTLHMKDGAFITVEERMSASGKVEFIGLVNIEVTYQQVDDN